jgi:hypothetical protein
MFQVGVSTTCGITVVPQGPARRYVRVFLGPKARCYGSPGQRPGSSEPSYRLSPNGAALVSFMFYGFADLTVD